MTENLAPIVLFTYNRPDHTRRTVEALQLNKLASQSNLFIFSDGPKSSFDHKLISQVREFAFKISGFKSVQVVEREINLGLASSIILGVTEIVNRFGRIIVLEDDIITSPNFLTFMNTALDKYEDEKKVWHISGWNYPISPEGLDDAFFWRVMNCWGWATWADRWQYFERDKEKLVKTWDKEKVKRFNLDGSCNFWGQVVDNYSGKLNTWGIFWYASIFEHDGLCLNPVRSFVQNIGHDGSGENCVKSVNYLPKKLSEDIYTHEYPIFITESELALKKIKLFYAGIEISLLKRLALFILHIFRSKHE